VFHISLGWFFIAVWVATGLLGYYEGKSWAKWVHWIALVIALQFHPTNALLIIPTLVLVVAAWWHNRETRSTLIRDTLIGWGLAALTLVPWTIGTAFKDLSAQIGIMAHERPDQFLETAPATFDLSRMLNTYARVIGAAGRFAEERATPGLWPPLRTERVLLAQAWFSFLGALVLLVIGLRRGWKTLPAAFFALITVFPLFAVFLIASIDLREWYISMVAFGAFPVMGIALAWLAENQRWRQIVVSVTVGVVAFLHLWLNIAHFHWLDSDGWRATMDAPMDIYRAMIAEQSAGGAEVVLDIAGQRDWATPTDQTYFWTIISEGYPLRLVNRSNNQGFPISTQRESLVISFANATPLIGQPEPFLFRSVDGEPVFQRTHVSPADLPELDLTPKTVDRFSNGARILGASAGQVPVPGQPWSIVLIWQIESIPDAVDYQFSLRLVNEREESFGQSDFPSLGKGLWRVGDAVISPATITVSEAFRPVEGYRLQILMYTWPEIHNADAVDAGGVPV
ncbi:MAG: hypothetical protein K8I30_14710, partial [Anaerolineae bacterium]|nr:hypothetical protein [Anaerolineae bacterium]